MNNTYCNSGGQVTQEQIHLHTSLWVSLMAGRWLYLLPITIRKVYNNVYSLDAACTCRVSLITPISGRTYYYLQCPADIVIQLVLSSSWYCDPAGTVTKLAVLPSWFCDQTFSVTQVVRLLTLWPSFYRDTFWTDPAGTVTQLALSPSWHCNPAGTVTQLALWPSWHWDPAGIGTQLALRPSWHWDPAGIRTQLALGSN